MPNTCPQAESGVLGVPRVRGRKGRQTPGLASHIWLVKPYIGIDEYYIGIDEHYISIDATVGLRCFMAFQ
jgi:hypothetical protein